MLTFLLCAFSLVCLSLHHFLLLSVDFKGTLMFLCFTHFIYTIRSFNLLSIFSGNICLFVWENFSIFNGRLFFDPFSILSLGTAMTKAMTMEQPTILNVTSALWWQKLKQKTWNTSKVIFQHVISRQTEKVLVFLLYFAHRLLTQKNLKTHILYAFRTGRGKTSRNSWFHNGNKAQCLEKTFRSSIIWGASHALSVNHLSILYNWYFFSQSTRSFLKP